MDNNANNQNPAGMPAADPNVGGAVTPAPVVPSTDQPISPAPVATPPASDPSTPASMPEPTATETPTETPVVGGMPQAHSTTGTDQGTGTPGGTTTPPATI